MTDAPVIDATVFTPTRIASGKQASDLAFHDFMMRVHFSKHNIHVPVAGSVASAEFYKIAPLWCSSPDIGLFGRRPRSTAGLVCGRLWGGKFTRCVGVARASLGASECRLLVLDNRPAHQEPKGASKSS